LTHKPISSYISPPKKGILSAPGQACEIQLVEKSTCLIGHILEHLAAGSESLPPGQSPSGAEPGSERPLGTEAFQGPAQPRVLSWKWGDSLWAL